MLWEVLSGTPILGMLVDKADEAHLRAWLNDGLELIGDLSILATLSDNEKALKAAMKTVCPDAPHQLCQEHFMSNLSEPVHEDDRALRQGLKEHLSPLPSVPDLSAEEIMERMEHLVVQTDTPGKRGAWRSTLPE
ncbi:MAG: transposase [Anaerolineae bacterium]